MKKLILLLLLIPAFSFSQASTTDEEYNYLTKGMQDQFDKGMNFEKNGYSFEMVKTINSKNGDRTFIVQRFKNSEGVTKALSITYFPTDTKYTWKKFTCFPINNSKLTTKFWRSNEEGFSSSLLYGLLDEMVIK